MLGFCVCGDNYERAGDFSPARHSKVSCYISRTIAINRTRPSAVVCSAVILTTSVNSNMEILREGASADAPAPALNGRWVAVTGLPFAAYHRVAIPAANPD